MYSVVSYKKEGNVQRIECINRLETWDNAIKIAQGKLKELGLDVDLKEITEDFGFCVKWGDSVISIQEI